jgi:hypothetical protein
MGWNPKDILDALTDIRFVTKQLSEIKDDIRALKERQFEHATQLVGLNQKVDSCVANAVSEARSAVTLHLATLFTQQHAGAQPQPGQAPVIPPALPPSGSKTQKLSD